MDLTSEDHIQDALGAKMQSMKEHYDNAKYFAARDILHELQGGTNFANFVENLSLEEKTIISNITARCESIDSALRSNEGDGSTYM